MIIHLRGTYGSGKTHLARLVMALYGEETKHYVEGRKRPLYSTFKALHGGKDLAVLGHYETPCGGCDTIPTMEQIFGTADMLAKDYDVLMEGMMISQETHNSKVLHDKHEYVAYFLDTPAAQCEEQVNKRRKERFEAKGKEGEFTPVDPANLLAKFKGMEGTKRKLTDLGVHNVTANMEEMLAEVKVRLGFSQ